VLLGFAGKRTVRLRPVDNRAQGHGINRGETRWKTLLWVKSHSILSLCACSTQSPHGFSTDLPCAQARYFIGLQALMHSCKAS